MVGELGTLGGGGLLGDAEEVVEGEDVVILVVLLEHPLNILDQLLMHDLPTLEW